MAGRKTVVRLDYNGNIESLCDDINRVLRNTSGTDLVYVNLSSSWFPRRMIDLPQ